MNPCRSRCQPDWRRVRARRWIRSHQRRLPPPTPRSACFCAPLCAVRVRRALDEVEQSRRTRGYSRIMTLPAALTAEGVTVQRGRVALLADFSFMLAAGEVVCVHGANGAGKTSLLKVLGGLSAPRRGVVRRNSAVAFVPEKVSLAPSLRPLEWLRTMRRLRGERSIDWPTRAAECGLDSAVLEKPSSALSKGMLQRIALVEALASDCGVLLLDEPSSGLDDAGRQWLASAIAARATRGTALMVAEHAGSAADDHVVSRTLEIADGAGRFRLAQAHPRQTVKRSLVVRSRGEDGVVSETRVAEHDVDDCLRRLLGAGHHIIEVR